MYSTLGVPSGAIGWVYGPQSGTDCVTSTLITPLNGLGISLTSLSRSVGLRPIVATAAAGASPKRDDAWPSPACARPHARGLTRQAFARKRSPPDHRLRSRL